MVPRFGLALQTPLSGIFIPRRLVFDSLWLQFRDQGVWANSQGHPKFGDGENKHLREEEPHSHTPRTSDSACVTFLTESAMLSRRNRHRIGNWSEFLTQQMTRYRRSPQVWMREWNLWAL